MPFFYSQYLRGDKNKGGGRGSQSRINAHPSPHVPGRQRHTAPPQPPQPPILKSNPINPITGLPRPHPSKLVNVKPQKRLSTRFKPLKPPVRKKKVVHFATVEVQPFHFDWSCEADVFFSRAELTAMSHARFTDAQTLQQRRQAAAQGVDRAADDAGLDVKSKTDDVAALLVAALEDDDADEDVSIRGIEHFVYRELQQEMLRQKKQARREVVEFSRSTLLDPQGWRLAERSRALSRWAVDVAAEKGARDRLRVAGESIPDGEREHLEDGLRRSLDQLDPGLTALRGCSSYDDGRGGAATAVAEAGPDGAQDAAAGAKAGCKPGDGGDGGPLQPPGAATDES